MYTEFYGLREKPFALSPDPRYLFLADSHREALAHLLYGIEQGEGFISVTGEVGTGKTTLCRTLLQRLEPGTEVAFIFNPAALGAGAAPGDQRRVRPRDGEPRPPRADGAAEPLPAGEEGRGAPGAADHRRGAEPRARHARAGAPALEPRDRHLEADPDPADRAARARRDARVAELRQLRQRISVRWRLSPLSDRRRRATTCATACASPPARPARSSPSSRCARSTGARAASRAS